MKGHEHGVPQKRERVFIVAVRDDVLDAIGLPFMCLSGLFPEPTSQRTSIGEAIDDLIDDEENIKDAEYLVDSMNQSSKAHWINGFDKHPDPDLKHCGPSEGLEPVLKRKSNSAYISIGHDIVGPWFQEQVKNGHVK